MKIKDDFFLKELGGKHLVIKKSDSNIKFTSMVTLNNSGKFLFESLSTNKTVDELVELLTNKYEIDSTKARLDVLAFIKKLSQENILEGDLN